jgi:hypothetical protein
MELVIDPTSFASLSRKKIYHLDMRLEERSCALEFAEQWRRSRYGLKSVEIHLRNSNKSLIILRATKEKRE